MKFKTVLEGQQAVILNNYGEGRLVVGPQRVFLFQERFNLLRSVTAGRDQYVEVQLRNGEIIHKPGPCQIFDNPLEHKSCTTRSAHRIDANHLLVVYKRLKGGEAERRIIQGPAIFMPGSEEWVHEFKWHGTDPDNKARMVPGLNTFIRLPTIPNNFYYNVRDVRTSDDSTITVKLMLFYEMIDILKMLDTTHDPIADLINAVCADVISFVGPLSYSQFIAKTNALSTLDTYPQLLQRADRIGFKVQKVVYRGYHASDQLQTMQNSAIESRTGLRLQREIEDQEQELTNFRLNKQQERSQIEQDMELKKQAYQQKLAQMTQDHKLAMQDRKLQQKMELASEETQLLLECRAAEEAHKIDHMKSLDSIGVDLHTYLALEYSPRPKEEIHIIRPKADGRVKAPATTHL